MKKLTSRRVSYVVNVAMDLSKEALKWRNVNAHAMGWERQSGYDLDSVKKLKMLYQSGDRSNAVMSALKNLQKKVKGVTPIKGMLREQQIQAKLAKEASDYYLKNIVGEYATASKEGKAFYSYAKKVFSKMTPTEVLTYLSKDKYGSRRYSFPLFQKKEMQERYNEDDNEFFDERGGNFALQSLQDFYIKTKGVLPN